MSSVGLWRAASAAVLGVALLAATASAGALETAKAKPGAGRSVFIREGKTTDVAPTTQFREGDIVRVPNDGRLTVEFADGATLTIMGGALRFGPMDGKGRRVVLGSGVISEAAIRGIAVEIQAPTPYDASFVLQNARGFARVNPGDKIDFQKLDGVYAKVYHAGDPPVDLGDQPWLLNVRDNTVSFPRGPRPAAGAPGQTSGDVAQFMLGSRLITYAPSRNFTKEDLGAAGARLSYRGEDFGTVRVGTGTYLFLADGESVTFDASGNVQTFDGIAHIYRPLEFLDQPVEASDASPVNPRKR